MSLGQTLLKYRRNHNYSQKQVAELLDVSQSSYCDWESDTSSPKIENLMKVAKLYDIDINELLPNTDGINFINSPNAVNVSNSPNSKVETSEALLKVAESLEKLVMMLGKLTDDKQH